MNGEYALGVKLQPENGKLPVLDSHYLPVVRPRGDVQYLGKAVRRRGKRVIPRDRELTVDPLKMRERLSNSMTDLLPCIRRLA